MNGQPIQALPRKLTVLILTLGLGIVLCFIQGCREARQSEHTSTSSATPTLPPVASDVAGTQTQSIAAMARENDAKMNAPAKSPLSEKEKIEALIQFVKKSDTLFIRGGVEYPSSKAADHLRMKWDYAGKRIKTARQFIDRIASKSSMTGKPYYVKSKDGKQITSAEWLSQALKKIESNQPQNK